MKIVHAVLLAAAMLSQPAGAQVEQTVEGAHRFLMLTVEQGTSSVAIDIGLGMSVTYGVRTVEQCRQEEYTYDIWGSKGVRNRCWNEERYANVTARAHPLVSTAANGACATILKFTDYANPDYADGWKIGPRGIDSVTLDWRKVAKVTANGSYVDVSPSQPGVQFRLASPDLAKRVAYAMEFLRQECDPAAATGF
ncbi:hypothetical protein ACFOMD_01100 [Sphingoaurantiacus capsulatus]|uniref:Uncharacterized protein n=1 Tax=Sphingoaurantiacus capsulatus TaxID=1771310 RepID=A0ABV7X591_9SPHN